MTREQFEAFVRETIAVANISQDIRPAIQKIADRWEEDTDASFQRGVEQAQESWDPNYME